MSRYNAPEWNPKRPQMPVDSKGNWLSYPSYEHEGWETIYQPFYAELMVDSMRTGRSSKVVVLKDISDGKIYPMFVADLVRGVQNGDFRLEQRADGGRLIGYWTGCKRGANYGIKAVQSVDL